MYEYVCRSMYSTEYVGVHTIPYSSLVPYSCGRGRLVFVGPPFYEKRKRIDIRSLDKYLFLFIYILYYYHGRKYYPFKPPKIVAPVGSNDVDYAALAVGVAFLDSILQNRSGQSKRPKRN